MQEAFAKTLIDDKVDWLTICPRCSQESNAVFNFGKKLERINIIKMNFDLAFDAFNKVKEENRNIELIEDSSMVVTFI
jgi:hypothetical protein